MTKCSYSDAGECSMARERSVAGVSNIIPSCSKHGQLWDVYWAPEGRKIATVTAKDARAAIRKAPYPYRRYSGEMYAKEI